MKNHDLPTSIYIEQRLREINNRKQKNTFLESIMTDSRATTLFETNGKKTIAFPGSKGPRTSTWGQTKKMAFELNKTGIDVTFLTETDGLICADSLLKIRNTYRLADFKYCVTKNSNTLAKELEHGFMQASLVVLKLRNMDAGVFKDAIGYILRNEIPYGNLILMNKYGKLVELEKRDIKTGIFRKKIRGLL